MQKLLVGAQVMIRFALRDSTQIVENLHTQYTSSYRILREWFECLRIGYSTTTWYQSNLRQRRLESVPCSNQLSSYHSRPVILYKQIHNAFQFFYHHNLLYHHGGIRQRGDDILQDKIVRQLRKTIIDILFIRKNDLIQMRRD